MNKIVECPICGKRMRSNGLPVHVKSCAKRPPDKRLKTLYDRGVSATHMAEHYQVSGSTVNQWWAEIGCTYREYGDIDRTARIEPDAASLVDPADGFAPEHRVGRRTGCPCGSVDICRARVRAGLWVLCELPSRLEVARAYRAGLIGFDSDMPEWLPELAEAIHHAAP